MSVKSCNDVHSAAARNQLAPFLPPPGCAFDRKEELPDKVLFFDGPTLILARTAHLPHWLEEISAALSWLAVNDAREDARFAHALVIGDDAHLACWSFQEYVTGSWAPNGSPLRETLQIQLLQTVAQGIVFSWGLHPGRVACFSSPWIAPRSCRGVTEYDAPSARHCRRGSGGIFSWGHPSAAPRFRARVAALLHPQIVVSPHLNHLKRQAYKVLVLQRSAGGRVVTNLHELETQEVVKQLPIEEVTYAALGQGEFQSALQQTRAFLRADIVVGHHGGGNALAVLMRPSSLFVEIVNYRTYCDYFDDLFGSLGLAWRRIFFQHGRRYYGKHHGRRLGRQINGCHGSNAKDAGDDAPVDIDALVWILQQYVSGSIQEGRFPGHEVDVDDPEGLPEGAFWSQTQQDYCCPTCQRCGYTMQDLDGTF